MPHVITSSTPAVSALRKMLPTLNADRKLSRTSTTGFFIKVVEEWVKPLPPREP